MGKERFKPGAKPGAAKTGAKKVSPLVAQYMKEKNPVAACEKDQIANGLTPEKAAARCAVLKGIAKNAKGKESASTAPVQSAKAKGKA